VPRSASASPFHSTVPSKSMSIVTTTGSFKGGGGLPAGMLRLTLCNCTGMVMINMMISTSITSISGVVLMSIITSGSPEPLPEPMFIPMVVSLSVAVR